LPVFNISLKHDKLSCWFWRLDDGRCWWQHIAVIARILRKILSDRDHGGERFSSKLINGRRNGNWTIVRFGVK